LSLNHIILPEFMDIKASLQHISAQIHQAVERAERHDGDVQIIAVTKTVDENRILEAIQAGLKIFGENRVQEASRKIPLVKSSEHFPIQWHLIGHLQKNKAKTAIALFDMIHSVDSPELLEEIQRQAQKIEKRQNVLIQVALSAEETKFGLEPDQLIDVLTYSKKLSAVNVVGLMTIPPYSENPESNRPYFRRLKELACDCKDRGFFLNELSMGMSNDFEVAVEEGATMVRIGTALFGARN
jgi:hypothetical protein